MRRHQFAKADCKCLRKATYFKCVHCGVMEMLSPEEVRSLDRVRAECPSPDAPLVPPSEAFKAGFGGRLDCLAPDWETHFAEPPPAPDCAACAGNGEDGGA